MYIYIYIYIYIYTHIHICMYVCMYYFALVTLLSDHIISTTKLHP